jgi:vitamin B12 transporter
MYLLVPLFVAIANGAAPSQSSEIVVTAPKELNQIPQGKFTTVIYPDQLPKVSVSLKDILETSPGIYVSSSNSQENEESASIRGFSAKQVRILVDSVPIDEGGAADINLANIPTSLIDKVIVTRGPLSSRFGNGAMGGVVNILTKQDIHRSKAAVKYSTPDSFGVEAESFLKPGRN